MVSTMFMVVLRWRITNIGICSGISILGMGERRRKERSVGK